MTTPSSAPAAMVWIPGGTFLMGSDDHYPEEADGAEADAADAIEFAAWTVDHARLALLDAIDARSTPTTSPGPQAPSPL